ncbi:aldehyde dehydrogenase family protein [Streptomyces sp. NPDC007162]|uniref:aldehyde dehydrogenase family protein n=1 Tax=Streptomyces sp. NPDC007162 TaxID=3156917 RepID=UPI0033FBB1BA
MRRDRPGGRAASGCLHVLPGGPEAGERLVRHPDVAKISFTGGIQTAKKILDAVITEGRLGRKTGHGFHRHDTRRAAS